MSKLFAALAILLCGCARFPGQGGQVVSTRLIFTMTVDGKIRSGQEQGSNGLPYVYMVAIRISTDANPTDQGPIPVIGPPWGNGFVAGNVTHFMWWNPQQSPRYGVYKFRNTDLTEWFQIGVPVTYQDVPLGGKQIQFELDLAQLAGSVDAA